jgi:hypothetical protein
MTIFYIYTAETLFKYNFLSAQKISKKASQRLILK